MKSICIFCGAHPGKTSLFMEKTEELSKLLVSKSWKVVYGGASVGLMGKIADSTIENGGEVLGVIPDFLNIREVGNKNIQDLRIVDSMHERKKIMYENSNAFLILPGGGGTMDEFFEVFTWKVLGLHHKPIGIYNLEGYYDPLINLLNHMIEKGFLNSKYMNHIIVESDINKLLEKIEDDLHPEFRDDSGSHL